MAKDILAWTVGEKMARSTSRGPAVHRHSLLLIGVIVTAAIVLVTVMVQITAPALLAAALTIFLAEDTVTIAVSICDNAG